MECEQERGAHGKTAMKDTQMRTHVPQSAMRRRSFCIRVPPNLRTLDSPHHTTVNTRVSIGKWGQHKWISIRSNHPRNNAPANVSKANRDVPRPLPDEKCSRVDAAGSPPHPSRVRALYVVFAARGFPCPSSGNSPTLNCARNHHQPPPCFLPCVAERGRVTHQKTWRLFAPKDASWLVSRWAAWFGAVSAVVSGGRRNDWLVLCVSAQCGEPQLAFVMGFELLKNSLRIAVAMAGERLRS